MEAADEFALGLRQVEGCAVGLAHHRRDVDEERREQDHGVPDRLLCGHDVGGGHRSGVEEDGDEGHRHRELVGDHLGRGAQAAEERVRRPGGPARQHDAVDADRRDGEDVEHRDGEVGELQGRLDAEDAHHRAEGDHREGNEGHRRRDNGGDPVDGAMGRLGDDLFLECQLEAVHERLQESEGADSVGADARLHARHDAALPPDREEREQHEHDEDRQDLEQDEPPGIVEGDPTHAVPPVTRTREPCEAPMARTREPSEAIGTQTAPSTTSAMRSGSSSDPPSAVIVTLPA